MNFVYNQEESLDEMIKWYENIKDMYKYSTDSPSFLIDVVFAYREFRELNKKNIKKTDKITNEELASKICDKIILYQLIYGILRANNP